MWPWSRRLPLLTRARPFARQLGLSPGPFERLWLLVLMNHLPSRLPQSHLLRQ